MKTFVFGTLTAALSLVSCGSSQKMESLSALSGEWIIEKISGQAIDKTAGDDIPFIGFDTKENRVYGSTSCNRITGMLDADAKKKEIDFSGLGSTRRMCANMDNEQKVLDALGKAKKFKIAKDGSLLLNDSKGKNVMELKHR